MKKSILIVFAIFSANLVFADIFINSRNSTPSTDSRAAVCSPASEKIFLELNNIRAVVETAGFLWEDRATSQAGYEYPKGSNSFVIFSGALWMGGEDPNGQLKLAAHRYRQDGNDFWPGPLQELNQSDGNYDPSIPQDSDVNMVRPFGSAIIFDSFCNEYDKFFSIRKVEVEEFIRWWNCDRGHSSLEDCEEVLYPDEALMDKIRDWPAHGDESIGQDKYLAPFYDNSSPGQPANGLYRPMEDGDYPWFDLEGDVSCKNDRRVTLYGDETHWWVFNDKGNIHTETGGDPIGMEIRAQAFSFATDDEVNDMTFYNYELINRGTQTLKNTYFGQYVDPDIGFAKNDYVGCDVKRGLGYCYNADVTDIGQGAQTPYGNNVPAVGIDFFEGPYQDKDGIDNPLYKEVPDSTEPIALMPLVYAKKGMPYAGLGIGYGDGVPDNERFGMQRFVYYNNSTGNNGDPTTAAEHYNYMKGLWRNGQPMTYGGDGFNGGSSDVPTRFMFPGDSDPLGWSTYPAAVPAPANWSEITADTPPEDRRFIQSAGPFELKPGAVNNITVGVVIGQSSETDVEAPIRALKRADTKAQDLFDNCFEVLEPPLPPVLTIQEMENELILFLSDPNGVPAIEDYVAEDFRIKTPDELLDSGIVYDNKFRFEGFQIYQMRDAVSSITDIGNLDKARLVAQTDVKNGVGKLVNYTFDEEIGLSIPAVMVEPAGEFPLDAGIRRSFTVTEDLFAFEDRVLVNHQKYYFLAVSYAQNEFLKYVADDPIGIYGQKQPYFRSRITATGSSIESVVGIPHDPSPEADGRVFTTSYGFQPEITLIEGLGNGGAFTELSQETVTQILANGHVDHPTYKSGAGPIDVKVIDPLNLKGGQYTLGFGKDSASINEDLYWIERLSDGQRDTIYSEKEISVSREQLILEWGISVRINQHYYIGNKSLAYTEPIGATISFLDSSERWVSFVQDDDSFYPSNWILTGNSDEYQSDPDDNPENIPARWIYQPGHYDDHTTLDKTDQLYEQMLDGGIAPFKFVAKGVYGSPFGFPGDDPSTSWFRNNESWFLGVDEIQTALSLEELHDVDIIMTSDKSKWSRCPVIEINDNPINTEHGDYILQPRSDASVDKQGLSAAQGGVASEANLTNETGMGWFPGYAMDVSTGARLNMVFAENSWLKGDNGDDMIWNPTSNYSDNAGNPLFGGMHYVYVFGEKAEGVNSATAYDHGEWLRARFESELDDDLKRVEYRKAWKTCLWVTEPMLAENQDLLATDVKISARIKMPYVERMVNGENEGFPMYQFGFENPSYTNDANRLISVIDNINVVPNPYYAYSSYETGKRDNRVKFTNLPERCEVTIFNMQGALVRRFVKDDPLTSLDWDLRNHRSIPIAGGAYIIHVKIEVPDENGNMVEHEKIMKWFGVLRQPDLDNL
ncbi:MAG: T9SS C-terminal target domain-containing protein [Crocinitomix sp.]|nr:T9SS C-terminal target domain-containing protein [Crocinitomix sp.]